MNNTPSPLVALRRIPAQRLAALGVTPTGAETSPAARWDNRPSWDNWSRR